MLTFSDRLQVLRVRKNLPNLHNFIILHSDELEALIRAAERWNEAKQYGKPPTIIKAAENELRLSLYQLTEKRGNELI